MLKRQRPGPLPTLVLAVALTVVAGLVAAGLGAVLAPVLELAGIGRETGLPVLTVLLQGTVILLGVQTLDRIAAVAPPGPRAALGDLQWLDLGRAVLALLLIVLVNGLLAAGMFLTAPEVIDRHQDRLGDVAVWLAGGLPFWLLLVLTLFIGYYEEVLARGLLLEQSGALLGRGLAAVVLSSVLFGLGHVYQGWYGVFQTAIVGAVFAALVLRWKRLWPVIIAHGLLNAVSLGLLRLLPGD